MIEQEIEIFSEDQLLSSKKLRMRLPKGTKILSNESYVEEMTSMYNSHFIENDIPSINDNKELTLGKIHSINKNVALIDIDSKNTAFCDLSKEDDFIIDAIRPGMVIDIKVKRKNDSEYIASISDAITEAKKNEILNCIGDKSSAFKCTVKELIHGGWWVMISGVKCFMPGSLGGINKINDFESLIGKEMIVMPITFSNEKNSIVVSHREYLKTLIPNEIQNLKDNIKEQITGVVTGSTKFGIFAEFNNCLTGLIPKEELKESLELFNQRKVNPGDSISFWVKDFLPKDKIILTQLGAASDPWEGSSKKYPPLSVINGKVIKKTSYGIFIELESGINGLLHKSQIGERSFEKGEYVNVVITSINESDKKISLRLL